MTKNEEKAIEILKNTRQAWCRILSRYIDKQQKEIEKLKELIFEKQELTSSLLDSTPNNKIREKLKELEEQKEKLKYDGDRCFADYEQFCKNLNFFKEQIDKILEEN